MSDQDFRGMTYWKATRLNGADFYTGAVDYAAALASGVPVTVAPDGGWDEGIAPPTDFPGSAWLHLATVPTECVGMSWPCRLFEVEPADDLGGDRPHHEHKVGATAVRVLAEVDAHVALGPQGVQVAALIGRCATLTADEVSRLNAARGTTSRGVATRDAARGIARGTARVAAWDAALYATTPGTSRVAAWDAARDVARDVALGAAWALLLRDLIGQHPGWDQDAYNILTDPYQSVIGPVHPDDTRAGGTP